MSGAVAARTRENADTVHGRLLEAVHLSGYTMERACSELEWLLEDNRWQQVGGGYDDFDTFMATIDLSEFKIAIEHRKTLAKKITDIGASQRATARALGVHHKTVQRDLGNGAKAPPGDDEPQSDADTESDNGADAPPDESDPDPPAAAQVSGRDAAKQAEKKIERKRKAKERRERREHEAAEAQRGAATGSVDVEHADALAYLDALPRGSADLLLTDPPYMTDVDDIDAFAVNWAPLALRAVKPDGRAYIFAGAYPDELYAYLRVLREHAPNGWTMDNILVWTYRNTIGPAPSHGYKLNWQACFYLYGPDAPPLDSPELTEQFTVHDVNAPDARFGVRHHKWQKPDELAERLIRHSTDATSPTCLPEIIGAPEVSP